MKQLQILLGILFFTTTSFSQSTDSTQTVSNDDINQLFSLSFDDLLNLKISTATKFDASIKETPSSIFVITKKEIETYGYRTLSEALQHVPGFYVLDDHTFYKENFGVRGFYRDEWNQNIIFLVNGVRQRSTYDNNNKLAYINVPIQAIEKIEIIKGPNSITYGAGAFFGVVNIITTSKNNKSEAYFSYGNQNTVNGGININETVNNLDVNIIASTQNTDGINQDYKDMGLDSSYMSGAYMKENQKYFALNAKKGSFYANISLDHNNNIRPVIEAPGASDVYENKGEFLANRSAIGVNHTFNERIILNSSYQFQYQQEALTFDFIGLDDDQETQLSTVESHEIDFHIKYLLNKNISFSTGGNYLTTPASNDIIDVPLIGLGNTNKHILSPAKMWGYYVRTNYKPHEKLHFNLGVRFDEALAYSAISYTNQGMQYIDPDTSLNAPFLQNTIDFRNTGTAVLPEASVIYLPNKNHTLKLIYGSAINRLPIFRASSSDRGIKPENIQSLELNHVATIHNKLQINSSLFYNYLYDLVQVSFEVSDGKQTQDLTNNGKFTTVGFESSLDYRPTKSLRIYVSGNVYKTLDGVYADTKPAFSPSFLGYLNVSYQFKDFTFAITNHYTSALESKFDHQLKNTTDITSEEKGRDGETAAAYLNSGLNIRYTPSFAEGIYLNVRVSNIFDQKMYYPVNDFNSWATNGTLGISRTYLITLGYLF